MKALAFIGGLSMGQAIGHSLRTAGMARRLAAGAGHDACGCTEAHDEALLQGAGCTADAPEFSALHG